MSERTLTAAELGQLLLGVVPRLAQLLAVEQPEHAANKKQHDLIERSWYGRKPGCSSPANRFGDSAIPDHDLYRLNRSYEESACRSHATSLGSEWNGSRSTERLLTTAGAPVLVDLSAEKDSVELSRLRRRERPRPEHVDDLICELPLFWRKRGRVHVPVQTSTKVVVEPRGRVGELVSESVQLANLLKQGFELRVANRHDLRSVASSNALADRGHDAVEEGAGGS